MYVDNDGGRLVPRKPGIDGYDSRRTRMPDYGIAEHIPYDVMFGGSDELGGGDALITRWIGADDWSNAGLDKQLCYDRTHTRDKRLAKFFEVDGGVPFAEAVKANGLVVVAEGHATRLVAANDNVPQEYQRRAA